MRQLLSVLLLLSFISSCGDQKIDTTKAREEMEAREIKVVSDAEILEKAMELGKGLSQSYVLKEDTVIIPVNSAIEASEELVYFNEKVKGKKEMLLKAYAYNAKNEVASEPNVQIMEDPTFILFTTPAYKNEKLVGMWAITFSRKSIVLSL